MVNHKSESLRGVTEENKMIFHDQCGFSYRTGYLTALLIHNVAASFRYALYSDLISTFVLVMFSVVDS